MLIENHQFTPGVYDGIEVTKVTGKRGPVIVPELIVCHYAVTDSLDATVRAQQARGYWAHLSVDGFRESGRSATMRVVQQVPFNERGSHAGKSSWKGRSSVNGFSIGIEIANPGPLIKQPDGSLKTVYGKSWPITDAEEHPVPKGYPKAWTHWAKYSQEEMGILATVCIALRQAYPTIRDIVGHSDIAPGRKFDPGEAFPMDWLRSVVFGGVA